MSDIIVNIIQPPAPIVNIPPAALPVVNMVPGVVPIVNMASSVAPIINITPVVAPIINVGVVNGGASENKAVKHESPNGLRNGSNATYISLFDFIPETAELFVNGLYQRPITDFNTSGLRTLILTDSPLSGDGILINYIKP